MASTLVDERVAEVAYVGGEGDPALDDNVRTIHYGIFFVGASEQQGTGRQVVLHDLIPVDAGAEVVADEGGGPGCERGRITRHDFGAASEGDGTGCDRGRGRDEPDLS